MPTHGLGRRDEERGRRQVCPAVERRPAKVAQLAERFGYHSVWCSDHVRVTRKPGSDWHERYLSGAEPVPNTYEDPRCQETNFPYERVLAFFPAFRGWRSRQPESCSDCMSLCRCRASVTAPHPYGGSLAVEMASAEAPRGVILCGLATYLSPRPVLLKEVAERIPFPS
jgi:hypothetical protein